MCPQALETEFPRRVDRPIVVVHLVLIFLEKVATPSLVQLKIEAYAASRPEDVCTSLNHGERKVPEFLCNSYRIDLLDKYEKQTFTIIVACTSVSMVCSRRATLSNRSLA